MSQPASQPASQTFVLTSGARSGEGRQNEPWPPGRPFRPPRAMLLWLTFSLVVQLVPGTARSERDRVHQWIWTRALDRIGEGNAAFRALLDDVLNRSTYPEEYLAGLTTDEPLPRCYAIEKCIGQEGVCPPPGDCMVKDHLGLPWRTWLAGMPPERGEPSCFPEDPYDPRSPCSIEPLLRIVAHEAGQGVDYYADALLRTRCPTACDGEMLCGGGPCSAPEGCSTPWCGWDFDCTCELECDGVEVRAWNRVFRGSNISPLNHFAGGLGGRWPRWRTSFDRYDMDCQQRLIFDDGVGEYIICLAYNGLDPDWVFSPIPPPRIEYDVPLNEFVSWALDYYNVRLQHCPDPTGSCPQQYALDGYLDAAGRRVYRIPPDFPGPGEDYPPDHDLGADDTDQTTVPAVYPLDFFAKAYLGLGSSWGDGMVRVLGAMAHYVADAGMPHHAGNTLGDLHAYHEAVVESIWQSKWPGILGTSSYCGGAEAERGENCVIALAHSYLGRVRRGCPSGFGRDYRRCEILELQRLLHMDSGAELDDLVSNYDGVFHLLQELRCPDAPTSATGSWYPNLCRGEEPYAVFCGAIPYDGSTVVNSWCDHELFYPDPAVYPAGCSHFAYETWLAARDLAETAAVREAVKREIDRSAAASLALLLIVADPENGFDAPENDTDGDTIPNVVDACGEAQGTLRDGDDDGVFDECDNCSLVPNAGQADTDRDGPDGIGDACDACPHSNHANAGRSFAAEYLAHGELDPAHDVDADGVADACDNCSPPAYPGEFPPPGYLAGVRKFSNPFQENCDWRFEVKWRDRGVPTLGDACDPEPCTGISPTPDWWEPPPGSTSPEPRYEDEVPYPMVPIEEGTMLCTRWDATHTTCLAAEPIRVDIPTTGYNPLDRDGDVFHDSSEFLPTMVRRCACWDRMANERLEATYCNIDTACATHGLTLWDPRPGEKDGWLAATVQQRYGAWPEMVPRRYRNEGLAATADWLPLEEWTDRIAFSRPTSWPLAIPPGTPIGEVDWHWFKETPPVGWDRESVDWSIWTRPHIDHPASGSHLAVTVGLSDGRLAEDVAAWDRVSKNRVPYGPCDYWRGGIACDDYANAYLPHAVRTRLRTTVEFPGPFGRGGRIAAGPPRGIPSGDWAEPSPPEGSAASSDAPGEWGLAAGLRPGVPVVRVVTAATAWGPDDGRFPNYDPAADTQGILVDWVTIPNGYADGDGIPSRMWPGQDAIDVSEFSLLFAGNAKLGDGVVKDEVRVTPPEPASALDPSGDDQWTLPGEDEKAPPGFTGKLYLFGGVGPDGAVSNRLWVGMLDGGGSIGGQVYAGNGAPNEWAVPAEDGRTIVWHELPAEPPDGPVPGAEAPDDREDTEALGVGPPGPGPFPLDLAPRVPPGIVGAALAMSADGRRIYAIAGYTDDGPNEDLWSYNLKRSFWERWGTPDGHVFLGRDPAVTSRDDVAYLYGGWTEAGPVPGLYGIDLRTRVMRRLDRDDGGPGARGGASIQLTADGRELVLFGGAGSGGWANDVWSFDLRLRRWTQLVGPCTQGSCPPVGGAGVLYERWSGRVGIVPAGIGATGQPYWVFERGAWVPAAEEFGDPSEGDCNGDGATDATYRWACRTDASWWAAAGRNECDTYARALVCDAEAQPPRAVNVLEQMKESRVALDAFGAIYATKHRRLRVFDARDPARPRQTANVQLEARARDVLLHEGILYVATDAGIEAWSRADRLRPRRLWTRRLPAGADDVVASGRTLVAIEPDGFKVYDIRIVTAPVELASHRLVRVLPAAWVLDGAASLRDLERWCMPGRRVAALFDRSLLVIADRQDLTALVLDLDGAVVRQLAPGLAVSPVTGVAIQGDLVYADTAGAPGGAVFRLGESALYVVGTHDLESWVDEARFIEGMAVRPAARGVEIAYDAP